MMEARFPGTAAAVAEAAGFTVRAVTWAARQGIGEYVVASPWLPLPGGVREAARAVIPGARVAYACDPGDASVLAYARAEAAALPGVTASAGPPVAVPGGGPACVVLAMLAHLMPAGEAAAMIAAAAAGLAPGSCVVVSAAVPDPGAAGDALIAAAAACAPVHRHPPAVIAGWLEAAGLEVVPPGVTDVRGWRAGMPAPRLRARPSRAMTVAGGVARVPG